MPTGPEDPASTNADHAPSEPRPVDYVGRKRFKKWETAFLNALKRKGSVLAAALEVGVDPKTPYNRRKKDPKFAAAWDVIVNACNDLLEGSAFERAVHGVKRLRFYKEKVIAEEREYSDHLTSFLLEKRLPNKYGKFGLADGEEDDKAAKVRAAMQAMRSTVAPPPEVDALRAELDELRRQMATMRTMAAPAPAAPRPRRRVAKRKPKK